tara:strand:- start:204 stop:1187 length:984 start_codon:yes stop_codon:yes gene_type:complete
MVDIQKEKEFYDKEFSFSYSSLNKLLFSPSLFYKDYILQEREIKTDRHLIEGKLIHCLLFEPEKLKEKFNVVPGKTPSDNVRKVLKDMTLYTDEKNLDKVEDFVILDSLKHMNLYQSLKADEARIAKIRTEDHKPYWEFLSNPVVDVVDNDTLERCQEQVEIIKSNKDVMELLQIVETDFELDPVSSYTEQYLETKLNNYKFGLKGYIDYYKIDTESKTITICDLKTTSKSIAEFGETVEFYNYWLQAAIYSTLVINNVDDEYKDYQILFKFVVIDKYDQVYVFDVQEETLEQWGLSLKETLDQANYHYTEKNYSLPYQFLTGQVIL